MSGALLVSRWGIAGAMAAAAEEELASSIDVPPQWAGNLHQAATVLQTAVAQFLGTLRVA